MPIRPYQSQDREACLTMFRSNMPRFFATHELKEFEEFLDTMDAAYFVVEEADRLLGCGGVFVKADGRTAGLCWGMVHRDWHGQGYGKALLQARLDWLVANAPSVEELWLDTTQFSAPFFAKFGFETIQVQADYYAPGVERHDMRLTLAPTQHQRLRESEAIAP